jgi:ribose/xylose/arabinose/galactoside ABC-type transport system permease subunit
MNPKLKRNLPLLGTITILLLLFIVASVLYPHFCSLRNVVNIFADKAGVGIMAVGMTLVIFAGGIDLSVGAVAGCSGILVVSLVERHGFPPAAAAMIALAAGAAFGATLGTVIQVFKQPPFLITLAGMFFARGCAFWISTDSIEIKDSAFRRLVDFTWHLGDDSLHPLPMLLFLGIMVLGCVLAHWTRFGRNLLAIGGSEQSALLMGLPVGSAKIAAYSLCGATAAVGGLANTLITGSGNSRYGIGLELDAIAAVVIGGTLLTGGRGQMPGTLCGVLILGTIKAALDFDGRLDPAWTRIIIGGLLLGFILLQRLLLGRLERRA